MKLSYCMLTFLTPSNKGYAKGTQGRPSKAISVQLTHPHTGVHAIKLFSFLARTNKLERLSREVLLKWKARHNLPTSTNQLIFIMQTFFFFKTSYVNEEVNRTEPSLLVRVPWFVLSKSGL
jgi:hypothetical protein